MKNAKRILFFASVLVCLTGYSQVEKGDLNIAANFTLNTTTGTDINTGNWSVFSQMGYYFTDNIEAGVMVIITGIIAEESQTIPGVGSFLSYSFLTDGGVVPYAGAQMFTLFLPSFETIVFDGSTTSTVTVTPDPLITAGVNVGAKVFFSENIFLNNRLDYGVVLSPDTAEGGSITLTVGIGIIF